MPAILATRIKCTIIKRDVGISILLCNMILYLSLCKNFLH